MRITVTSTFNPNRTPLEIQSTTLRALLVELSKKYKPMDVDDFYDGDKGEVYPDCVVLLNGKSYKAISDGLNTRLKDGDKLESIQLFVIVGG